MKKNQNTRAYPRETAQRAKGEGDTQQARQEGNSYGLIKTL